MLNPSLLKVSTKPLLDRGVVLGNSEGAELAAAYIQPVLQTATSIFSMPVEGGRAPSMTPKPVRGHCRAGNAAPQAHGQPLRFWGSGTNGTAAGLNLVPCRRPMNQIFLPDHSTKGTFGSVKLRL